MREDCYGKRERRGWHAYENYDKILRLCAAVSVQKAEAGREQKLRKVRGRKSVRVGVGGQRTEAARAVGMFGVATISSSPSTQRRLRIAADGGVSMG